VFTSAVLGTLSQKTSILIVPRLVCRVTDMLNGTRAPRIDLPCSLGGGKAEVYIAAGRWS